MSPRPARPRPRARSVALVAAATTFTTLGAAGCASVTVKPSEREVLSRRELDPATEDEECQNKAAAVLRALTIAEEMS